MEGDGEHTQHRADAAAQGQLTHDHRSVEAAPLYDAGGAGDAYRRNLAHYSPYRRQTDPPRLLRVHDAPILYLKGEAKTEGLFLKGRL
jgi:hypothetical protein